MRKNKIDKHTQKHFDFLRRHRIGKQKAARMAKLMTKMDKRG